jgi:hypothetical protein
MYNYEEQKIGDVIRTRIVYTSTCSISLSFTIYCCVETRTISECVN